MMVREIAESMGCFDQIDFLDDNNSLAIGPCMACADYVDRYRYAVVAIGNAELRMAQIEMLEAAGYEIATLVAPTAYVSPSAKLGKGTVIEPNAGVQTGASVGLGCIISSGAVVRHNACLGNVCHVDCNAVVLSGATVPIGTVISPISVYPQN